MSSTCSRHSPDAHSVASGELSYPHHWLGSNNPINEPAHIITPTTTTTSTSSSHQHFLQYYGFQTTPVAIYIMNFEDGPRVKGQPKMFHANFTHPGSNIVIDGKVYTHKAFSNQQAAYKKDRYGMCMVSPTLCYTLHGVVDNEKKRVERIARELRLDGEAKCAKKKRRQVFKINDSAVMMRRPGFEADYPTYAFNTNATYTIAFYSRHTVPIIHTGVRYIHCEDDVFVHIQSSHGGEIMLDEQKETVITAPTGTRKRKQVVTTTTKKEITTKKQRRTNEIQPADEPVSPVSHPTISPVSTVADSIQPLVYHPSPVSPISPSTPDSHMESQADSQDYISDLPIISESSFISDKRSDMLPYEPLLPSYGMGMYGGSLTHPLITGPSLPPLGLPSLPPLGLPTLPLLHSVSVSGPSHSHYPSSSSFDFPLVDPVDPFDTMLPESFPSLHSMFSLQPTTEMSTTGVMDDPSWF